MAFQELSTCSSRTMTTLYLSGGGCPVHPSFWPIDTIPRFVIECHASVHTQRGASMFRLLSGIVCLYVFAAAAHGQTAGTATLLGNVNDPSGATVVAAKIAVVNPENSFTTETLTTAEGT